MYRLLTGKQRSLVFPVMCNAFVRIDYTDNIPSGEDADVVSDDKTYGLWNHRDSFTIETTLTPYDINGPGGIATIPSVTASKKMMDGISRTTLDDATERAKRPSHKYLKEDDKEDYEMRVFHSSKVKLSLVNDTEHTVNNPSKYRVKFELTLGSTNKTLLSPVVISPLFGKSSATDNTVGFDYNGKYKYEKATSATISSYSAILKLITFDANIESDFHDGQELFIRNGFGVTSIGKVDSNGVSGTTVELASSYSGTLDSSTPILIATTKNPIYTQEVHHIAATYNNLTKVMKIYYGGVEVASTEHTATDNFAFDKEDFYLGSNGTSSTTEDSAKDNNQFMGELHEFAIVNGASEVFDAASLRPRYAETLLYFRFEEVDA
jgi:hypothetical protein